MNILEIFVDTELRINRNKLENYIHFCKDNALNSAIKGETSHHHILPKAKNLPFTKYSDLKKNSWNGVHLTYKNHYIAHSMLAEAIDNFSIISAWYDMNNKDTKRRRINEPIQIIGADLYHSLMSKRDEKYKAWCKEEVTLDDGLITSNGELRNSNISKTKLSNEWKESVGKESVKKRLQTMEGTFNDIANKTAKTRKKNGSYITGSKKRLETIDLVENGKKISAAKKGKCGGKNNANAKVIKIYDTEDNEMFVCEGDFEAVCKENNLPTTALKTSYLEETAIYENLANNVISRVKGKGWYQYKGWYARVA